MFCAYDILTATAYKNKFSFTFKEIDTHEER